MLSTRMVQLIEAHWDEIAQRLLVAIREHPDMEVLAHRPEIELREYCRKMLENLGDLLAARNNEDMQRQFQSYGQIRYQENIPLHEAVLRFHLLKQKVLQFIHEQGFPVNAVQLYAEEELVQRIGWFFDSCVYHVVYGYEHARGRSARIAS